jgi:hypothetical protein
MQRRRIIQTLSLEERLAADAKRLREEAELLPAVRYARRPFAGPAKKPDCT